MDLLTPAQTWAARENSESAPVTDDIQFADAPIPRMPLLQQITMFLSTVGPIVGLVLAIVMLWHRGPVGVGWLEITAMLSMYALAGFGVTIGFHRLLTHRAFESPRWLRLLLAIFGSIAAQGAVIRWCATHRQHHQSSDRDGDPHSPNMYGDTPLALLRGMWHAHMGWLFYRDEPGGAHTVQDLLSDRAMLLIDKLYFFWVFIGILIPAVAMGLWTSSWYGALSGAVWGGFVRICLMQHATWSINSVCHVWGRRPFRTSDHSANNWMCAVIALGEGWHNNHHAFPTSARHGMHWWQFDSSWLLIRGMAAVGLVWNIRMPSEEAMNLKLHQLTEVKETEPRSHEAARS